MDPFQLTHWKSPLAAPTRAETGENPGENAPKKNAGGQSGEDNQIATLRTEK